MATEELHALGPRYTEIDHDNAVFTMVDDVAELAAQVHELHRRQVTEEHRVLQREPESRHARVHHAEPTRIGDVVCNKVAVTSHVNES